MHNYYKKILKNRRAMGNPPTDPRCLSAARGFVPKPQTFGGNFSIKRLMKALEVFVGSLPSSCFAPQAMFAGYVLQRGNWWKRPQ